MRFLGVYREQMFSPGRVQDDTAILDATLSALRKEGHETDAIRAEALDGQRPDVDCVLTMGQSERVLDILEDLKSRGVRIVNPVASIRSCNRAPLIRLLAGARLPLPPGELVPLESAERSTLFPSAKHYWVKRGDAHKVEPGDVVRVTSQGEFEAALGHFRRRRIAEVLVQEHTEGEVIKFYGVSGGLADRKAYFAAFPEGKDEEIADNLTRLSNVAERAAATLGLEVYGGDMVVTPAGRAILIDLNAWPSFSRCRRNAAQRIALYVAGGQTCRGAGAAQTV